MSESREQRFFSLCNKCKAEYAPICSICYDAEGVKLLADQASEIARLEAEVKDERESKEMALHRWEAHLKKSEKLEAEVARLREGLRKWGQHLPMCATKHWVNEPLSCTCGFSDALSAPPYGGVKDA